MQLILDLQSDRNFQDEVKFSTEEYRPNEKIVNKGMPHEFFYIIISGKVSVTLKNESNMPETSITLYPNDSIGEYALFDNLPASADVMADTKVEVLQIDIPSFRIFLEKHPNVGYKICLQFLRKLIKRLRDSNKTIASLYTDQDII